MRVWHRVRYAVARFVADNAFPPARFASNRVIACYILITGKCMADEDSVRAVIIQFAVCLKTYIYRQIYTILTALIIWCVR